ncbi:hypothetical protein TUBRATIS_18710 [Tubulinosema ratisbonensis]|uniref:Uncharacterized protein n=1 Tax=Tubulinosema ratisbonensis TaxID=291195 RepID=A0A437AKF9_9MICR|nr:hypothetical protein TUBRATIS_18710 [Tubulinosema ratisbonensis]
MNLIMMINSTITNIFILAQYINFDDSWFINNNLIIENQFATIDELLFSTDELGNNDTFLCIICANTLGICNCFDNDISINPFSLNNSSDEISFGESNYGDYFTNGIIDLYCYETPFEFESNE